METKETEKPETPTAGAALAPQPVIVLTVTYNLATGEVALQGPVGNKTLCYGMIKQAEKLIDAHQSPAQAQQQQGVIERIKNSITKPGFRGFKQPH